MLCSVTILFKQEMILRIRPNVYENFFRIKQLFIQPEIDANHFNTCIPKERDALTKKMFNLYRALPHIKVKFRHKKTTHARP